MKPYLFLMLIFIIPAAHAQKCKFDYEKKDPFNGEETAGIAATLSKTWKIGFNRSGDHYNTVLLMHFQGVKEEIINKGDTFMLALDAGTPMTLIAADNALPHSNVAGNQILTAYRPGYVLSKEQLRELSLKKIKAIKVYFKSAWISLEIPEKNAEKIAETAACMFSHGKK